MFGNFLFYLLIFYCMPLSIQAVEEKDSNLSNILELDIPQCIHNHPITEQCAYTLCQASTPYGSVYAKVKSMPDGTCQYIERIPGFGGINCIFEKSELKYLHSLFAKNFERFAGMDVIMTVADFKDLSNIYDKKCTLHEDYLSNEKVALTSPKENFFDPEFSPAEISKYITNYYESYHNETRLGKLTLNDYSSVFLKDDELNSARQFQSKLSSQNKNKLVDKDLEIAQFHIDSIDYVSPENWTVKLNEIEYTSKNLINYVIFENVTPQVAQIKWFINNLDKISPKWSHNLIALGEGRFKSKDNNILVQTGAISYTVIFNLMPNQVLDIISMKIVDKSKS